MKIKYLFVLDKLYEVTDINFSDLILKASETDLLLADVPVEEVFDISDFKDFHVTLRNWHGNIVDFAEYVKKHK